MGIVGNFPQLTLFFPPSTFSLSKQILCYRFFILAIVHVAHSLGLTIREGTVYSLRLIFSELEEGSGSPGELLFWLFVFNPSLSSEG